MKKIMFFIAVFGMVIATIKAQQYTTTKIAVPISEGYIYAFYNPIFLSANEFIATKSVAGQEYIARYTFGIHEFKEKGLVIPDTGVAIAGQINGRPYLYLQYQADVVPGFPNEYNSYLFDTNIEEVFVGGNLENIFIVARTDLKKSLDICTIKMKDGIPRYEIIPTLSDNTLDENGIFFVNDTIIFSRKDKKIGFYALYKSILEEDIYGQKNWTEPEKLPEPYNIEGSNSLYYFWYEGIEYISSDRNDQKLLQIYAIGTQDVLEKKFGEVYTTDADPDSENDYSYKLKIKVGSKVYEEYVNAKGYSFYNSIIDLTDSMHVSDTVYIKEIPEYILNSGKVIVLETIQRKNGTDWYIGVFKHDTVTLLPVDVARRHNLNIDENLIKKENIINKEDMFLVNTYVVYSHSLHDNLSDPLSTDQLKDKVLSGHEFSEEELIHMFSKWKYAECYVQLGFYKKRLPSVDFTQVLLNRYTVTHSPRTVNNVTVGTQYYVECSFERSLVVLKYSISRFNHEGINDDPFIRIGKWDEKFTIIKLRSGRYLVEYNI